MRLHSDLENEPSWEQKQAERAERAAARAEQERHIVEPLATAERIAERMMSLAGRMRSTIDAANRRGLGTRTRIGGPPTAANEVHMEDIEAEQQELRARYKASEVELARAMGQVRSLVQGLSPGAVLPVHPAEILTLRKTLAVYWNIHLPKRGTGAQTAIYVPESLAASVSPKKRAKK
jgi:hypothetical protein